MPAGLLLVAALATAGPAADVSSCEVTRTQPLERLQSQCAYLKSWLARSGFESTLHEHSRNGVLYADLVALWNRYQPPAGAAPDTASLGAIAAQLNGKPAAATQGWWERLKRWALDWFHRHAPDPDSAFNRWLERLAHSNRLLAALGYGCIGLVVIAAGGVIVNELWRAGLLRRRRQALPPADGAGYAVPPPPGPAPVADLGHLLQRIVVRLEETHRLTSGRSSTHRELVRSARLEREEQRGVLGEVAARAEEVRYGGRAPNAAADAGPVRRGEALLRELDALGPP